jgi:Zn-dependent M28 family amino/carboxypeptidase
MDPSLEGDQIFNGALTTRRGVASLRDRGGIHEAPEKPERSLLFVSVTARRRLLGAKYYAENPLYPLARRQ